MNVGDLDLRELLELDAGDGAIRFAGQRVLLLDAMAMGVLRKYLVENFGKAASRTVLTQFGFAHGWRIAQTTRTQFNWEDGRALSRAGVRIHSLAGLFRVEANGDTPLDDDGMTLTNSYEAEQHLLHFGRSESPVCWTLCGLLSGQLSRSSGQEIIVLEDRCVGRGDAACHMRGRTREEWGNERPDDLGFFEAKGLRSHLDASLQRVTETLKVAERRLAEAQRALVAVAPEPGEPAGIVARAPRMRRLVDLALRVAKVDATVLITGESGSGKERIARLLHDESPRAAGPFIAVNCGAIAETLLESELFGHARGSFTGASHDRLGLFESANTGTLLLDEVGEVSPAMQVKLLRVLQEREIRRVGESKTRRVDVRVLAATNRDLARGVAGGSLREDLYYRLKVIELGVPALRERNDDIIPLARILLAAAARQMKRNVTTMSPAVLEALLRYSWPGNVRELENAMARAAALASGHRVELDDLPDEVRRHGAAEPAVAGMVRTLELVERDAILAALAANSGNRTLTASQLGIGSATLFRKLKGYGPVA